VKTTTGVEELILLSIALCGGDEERRIKMPLAVLSVSMSQGRMKKKMLLRKKRKRN
jgi:hypothetical protein